MTASVFINDNESGLHRDFERWLEELAPEKPHGQYDHNGYESAWIVDSEQYLSKKQTAGVI